MVGVIVLAAAFHWRIPPTPKMVFDPAVGLDLRSPALGLTPSEREHQPAVGGGVMLLSYDECRIRLLGVGYSANGRGGAVGLVPFSIRLSGEPGQGWNLAPVYLIRERHPESKDRWGGVALQLSLRFSSRVDADIPTSP